MKRPFTTSATIKTRRGWKDIPVTHGLLPCKACQIPPPKQNNPPILAKSERSATPIADDVARMLHGAPIRFPRFLIGKAI